MRTSTRVFQENLSIICDELELAKKWGKASIILTTHKSTHSQTKLRRALQKELLEIGYDVVDVEINSIEGNFIKHILNHENVEDIVFCISKIGWGGESEGDGYRTLNLYRETFVERKIKAVFLLTLQESLNMPHYAPDFWAFRQRVFGFVSPQFSIIKTPPVGLMLWHIDKAIKPSDASHSQISNLKNMLSELPEQEEAISLRIGLNYELGFNYWYVGDHLNAEKVLNTSLELAKSYKISDQLVRCQNGLSIIYYEKGYYDRALELLEQALKGNPKDCLLHFNQAIALFAVGKRYIATQKGKSATTLCVQNPWGWNSLGFLYYFLGNMDEAEVCFQTATDIAPENGYFFEALAVCYKEMGLCDKAIAQLSQSKNDSDYQSIIRKILKAFIQEEKEKTTAYLEEGISTGTLTRLDIARNPILSMIFIPNESG